METNITNWQRKQNQNNNFSAVIPYDLEQQRKESKEFLDDLTTRDQRMMFAVLAVLQQQMVDNSGDRELVEQLEDQMDDLRGDRQDILAEAAERTDLQSRMNDMISFLDEMPQAITEYSDSITRRLVEKVTIFDEKIVVELKSGLQMEVEA